jgi:hypothetical protein
VALQRHDLVAARNQCLGNSATEPTRRTRDKDAHA